MWRALVSKELDAPTALADCVPATPTRVSPAAEPRRTRRLGEPPAGRGDCDMAHLPVGLGAASQHPRSRRKGHGCAKSSSSEHKAQEMYAHPAGLTPSWPLRAGSAVP